jgi:hypothetical protein
VPLTCQNASVEGQRSSLKVCYAKERTQATGPAADALQVERGLADWLASQHSAVCPFVGNSCSAPLKTAEAFVALPVSGAW